MGRTLLLSMLAAIVVWTAHAPALASTGAGVGRTPTVTRLVRLFSGLEDKLGDAVQKHDMVVVSSLLSTDFEMRIGAMPDNPIPRAVWIQRSFEEPLSSGVVEQMAVHGMGDVAIASYTWEIKPASAKKTERVFVVDVWRKKTGRWKLAVRYADPVGGADERIPGAPGAAPTFRKKE